MTKQVRLAFSGSAFKFPALAGGALAVRDLGYTPIEYAGTSGGSIIAALLACGMSLEDMRSLCLTHNWSDMLEWNPTAIFKKGYCNGNNLYNFLYERTGGKRFKDLDIDLTVMASDVTTEDAYIFSRTLTPDVEIALAVRASTAIPFVYTPVAIADALLYDGGMVDNLPADHLTIGDIPRLGINLVSKATPFAQGSHSAVDVVTRLLDLMLTANENAHISLAKQSGASFAFVETGYANSLDRNMPYATRVKLFKEGYNGTVQALTGLELKAA